MNKIYVLQEDELRGELYRRIYHLVKRDRWTRQSIGASIGLAGGLLSIILGTLLWMIVPLLTPGRFGSLLNTVEITFFALSLPLMALGAYCLDLLEKKTPDPPLPAKSHFAAPARLLRLRTKYPHKN